MYGCDDVAHDDTIRGILSMNGEMVWLASKLLSKSMLCWGGGGLLCRGGGWIHWKSWCHTLG